MDGSTDAVRARFDRWARSYEEDPVSRWLATLQRTALTALELRPEDRLLDLGCGSGAAVREAARVVKQAVGIDVSPRMVERARALAHGIENVAFQEGNAERLPFADGEFNAVLCTTSFHHYADPRRAVGEIARVLAPGGRAVIGDGCADRLEARILDALLRRFQPSHVRLYRSSELGGFLFNVGFDRVRLRKLLAGGYLLLRTEKPD